MIYFIRLFIPSLFLFVYTVSFSQELSDFIIVDQFGYLPESPKIAIIKNPQQGFDESNSFTPGPNYALINAESGMEVFSGSTVSWKNGQIDASSGDQIWQFDFSTVTTSGKYYILDVSNNHRSFEFEISPSVYNNVLKQAVRTFFYQRSGFPKDAQYAGAGWADGASHIGPLQDKNCRYFGEPTNAATERDVSGGWYDAGDYNKYTNWTANYVVEMMKAYLENPKAWGDDYNIPESGNGIPDLLDEAKWGIDHLLRLQQGDGGVLSIVDAAHSSPPSLGSEPSLYGPASTSATLNTAAALAISSKVFRLIGWSDYANTLQTGAINAWNWATTNHNVIFRNNDASYNSQGIGAGQQEESDYQRSMSRLEAACFLFDITQEAQYKNFFDTNYRTAHLFEWNFAYPFETENQELLLYYTTIEGASPSVVSDIQNTYRSAMMNGSENFPAYDTGKDPYLAHIKDYTWGSNRTKSAKGNMFYSMISYTVNGVDETKARNAAIGYIHYLHGVNPLNMVYLSNMYDHGAENSVNEFYHTWFTNGSNLWDRVGTSTYGPPPGFVTGGPNPSYSWDGCCPNNCGSAGNNAICNSENLSPPQNQPAQKSYKDFNTSWPLNSWSITENSCGYQVAYIRLLSKFVEDANLSTNIEQEKPTYSLRIFPNPNRGILYVDSDIQQVGKLQIIDIHGRKVLEEKIRGDVQLDINHLSSGYYHVIAHFGEIMLQEKLVKLK